MKVIIAGSRTFCRIAHRDDPDYEAAKSLYDAEYALLSSMISELNEQHVLITEVISGTADGADQAGERWAAENNVPVSRHKPIWDLHGKSAGIKRNLEMGLIADAAVIAIKGKSKGSTHMANYMKRQNKPIIVKEIE